MRRTTAGNRELFYVLKRLMFRGRCPPRWW